MGVVSKHISVIYLRSIIIAYLAKLNELSSTMSSGFITESEAIDIRKKRQEEWEKVRSATDPIERPEEPYDSRSLYDRLQEQKQKKDLEYEEAHKLKNMIKGLDDDEIDFLELVDKTKMAADLKKSQEEEQELNDYRNRVATLQEKALDQKLGIAVPNKPKAANQNNKRSQMKLLQGAVVKKEENSKKRKVSEEQEEEEGSNSKAGTTVVPSALKCIGILPGMGCYSDSSSEDTSDSDSEIENEGKQHIRLDLLGRKIAPAKSANS